MQQILYVDFVSHNCTEFISYVCVCVCVCVCVKCLEFSTYKLMSFYFFVSYLDTFYIIFLPNCPSKGFQ